MLHGEKMVMFLFFQLKHYGMEEYLALPSLLEESRPYTFCP